MFRKGDDPFEPENFQFTRSADESRAINEETSGIILAGSGMCSGGRIMHHLKHNLYKHDTHVLFVGYQAHGTLGRRLVDSAKEIRIAGEDVSVKAQLHTLNGFRPMQTGTNFSNGQANSPKRPDSSLFTVNPNQHRPWLWG